MRRANIRHVERSASCCSRAFGSSIRQNTNTATIWATLSAQLQTRHARREWNVLGNEKHDCIIIGQQLHGEERAPKAV
jgi:hypothetical protein